MMAHPASRAVDKTTQKCNAVINIEASRVPSAILPDPQAGGAACHFFIILSHQLQHAAHSWPRGCKSRWMWLAATITGPPELLVHCYCNIHIERSRAIVGC